MKGQFESHWDKERPIRKGIKEKNKGIWKWLRDSRSLKNEGSGGKRDRVSSF